jgi:hypothetical protein
MSLQLVTGGSVEDESLLDAEVLRGEECKSRSRFWLDRKFQVCPSVINVLD